MKVNTPRLSKSAKSKIARFAFMTGDDLTPPISLLRDLSWLIRYNFRSTTILCNFPRYADSFAVLEDWQPDDIYSFEPPKFPCGRVLLYHSVAEGKSK